MAAARQTVFHRHRKKTLFAILLLMVPALDIGVTAALRIAGLYEPEYTKESAFRRRHPLYHHDLRPSIFLKDGGLWGQDTYDICTNSLAFKDAETREIPLEPPKGKKRVVLIGDSFTEGVGVTYPGTFVGILDRELGGRGIEILNAGVATYSPVIYRRKCEYLLDELGLKFDHLVVCLDISDIIDETKHYRLDENNRVQTRFEEADDAIKTFIRDNTILMSACRRILHDWKVTSRDPERNRHKRKQWTSDPVLWERWAKDGLVSAGRHLHALHEILQRHGVGMTLVVYPWPEQIEDQNQDCIQVTHWRDWAKARSIAFVNAFPKFLDAGDPEVVIHENFIVGDVHWNEAGHKMIADVLLEQLKL